MKCSHEVAVTNSRVTFLQASKQLEAAFKYLDKHGDAPLDLTAFESACGVGVVVRLHCFPALTQKYVHGKWRIYIQFAKCMNVYQLTSAASSAGAGVRGGGERCCQQCTGFCSRSDPEPAVRACLCFVDSWALQHAHRSLVRVRLATAAAFSCCSGMAVKTVL